MQNWKTTVAGIIAGAIPFLQGISESLGKGVPIQWGPIAMGLAIMALGIFAKDLTTVAKVLALGLLISHVTACSMSLEQSRADGITKRAAAAQAQPTAVQVRPDSECKALDSLHVWTGYGLDLDLAVGAGAGVAAASTTGTARSVSIGVGTGAAVVAAAVGYWHDKLGASWTEECAQ